MRRMPPLALCLLLALAVPALSGLAFGAQPHAQAPAAMARATPKPKAKTRAAVAVDPRASSLNSSDLDSPYSALVRQGVSPGYGAADSSGQGKRPGMEESLQSNATSWKMDVTLTPKDADADSPMRFKVGGEKVVDPITGEEISRKTDPTGAKNNQKDLDIKGAAERVGGKAEVQVDIFKF